jgi:hypothetical protein
VLLISLIAESNKNIAKPRALKASARVKRWELVGWKLEQRRGSQPVNFTQVIA